MKKKRTYKPFKKPEGTDKVWGFEYGEAFDEEEYMKLFILVMDKDDPDGPTHQYVAKDMDEAREMAAAITYFHDECEINIDDDIGEITVYSYGKKMGRLSGI